jgi:MFS family permease
MASSPQVAPSLSPWLVAIAVMSSTFMEVLDTTVVNVSLPHIAGNLSASTDEATWTLTSYLVANAIILPMTGWLARQFRTQAAAHDVGARFYHSFIFFADLPRRWVS